MKCLVQLCAIRITFWDGSKELNSWIQFWLGMSKDVIQNQKGKNFIEISLKFRRNYRN
jgi:hypothetical protein